MFTFIIRIWPKLGDEYVTNSIYNFEVTNISGETETLEKYNDKVLLIVNVASKCGLTPQYKQLQALHETYSPQGLAVLGFPCNQFLHQEPGTAEEIAQFCQTNYGVEFDLFAKINVNGADACDLYKHLTSLDTKPKAAGPIKWNFEKFLVNRRGEVIKRYPPQTTPEDSGLLQDIADAL